MQGIYKISNILTGKYYVGSSIDIGYRWSQHRSALENGTHKNDKLQNAWRYWGAESFVWEVSEELPMLTEEELRKVEDGYLSICEQYPDTNYNCCYDSRGGSLSAHSIEKIRRTCRTVPRTDEWRRNQSEGNKRRYRNGFQFSEEAKQRMAFRGIHTEETKAKIAKTLTGTHRPTKNSDMTVRTFGNRKTDETVTMPTYDFRVKYNLDPTMFCRLIKGKANRCGEWFILSSA